MKIAIVGSGPAALMAAEYLIDHKNQASIPLDIQIFEKRPAIGRKLLIAGASGLNISFDCSKEEFFKQYRSYPTEHLKNLFSALSPGQWLSFFKKLQLETYTGTSGRILLKEAKAARFLELWKNRLLENGVQIFCNSELKAISPSASKWELQFTNAKHSFDRVILALGGGSWLDHEAPDQQLEVIKKLGVHCIPFSSSNCGYDVEWGPEFLSESTQQPLKSVEVKTSLGSKQGDLMITQYGLEGTPLYHVGTPGICTIDFFPNLTADQLQDKLSRIKENLSPLRRLQKIYPALKPLHSLLFHFKKNEIKELASLVRTVKKFELLLKSERPLTEAISSKGGVDWSELNEHLELNRFPGIYCVGEMINWDAPTGGFLIQGCVSQGALVAKAILITK